MEILDEYGYDAAYFITTAPVDTNRAIWSVNLSLLLLKGSRNNIKFKGEELSLRSHNEKKRTFNHIKKYLKSCTVKERRQLYHDLLGQYPPSELDELMDTVGAFKMFNWEELKELSKSGCFIQSHSVNHEIQNATQPREIAQIELLESKKILESHLKKPITWFAV